MCPPYVPVDPNSDFVRGWRFAGGNPDGETSEYTGKPRIVVSGRPFVVIAGA